MAVYIVFPFALSHQWQKCHHFEHFGQHRRIYENNKKKHLLGIDTDPDLPDPFLHALDADTDPDPAKWCESDAILAGSGSTTLCIKIFLASLALCNRVPAILLMV